ncbi:small subunit ribosomal protein S6 [Haloferula luteola]|uniref:Small ribosomal subunit protein bS6 n=1 Tax=Haloferula luteola TaxID=595692 RepID=A0A840UYN3_9BACT|nr:30S ribosomal protein S6 [Haloferula luteola]MBB5350845.1 small subunit ribosomal protein S6 [Haloferula luteola]
MSRKYEGLIILNTKGIDSSLDELVQTVGKEIEAEGAKLDEVKPLGRRPFAYPQKHAESGHYVNYFFSAEPSAVAAIQTRLKLNPQVELQHYQVR